MGDFYIDRYEDELTPQERTGMQRHAEQVKQYWKKASRDERIRNFIEEHRRQYVCYIRGCRNTSIGPYSTFGGTGTDGTGMAKCFKCHQWTCIEHLRHFHTPYLNLTNPSPGRAYLTVCINCLPFNASKMDWPAESPDMRVIRD